MNWFCASAPAHEVEVLEQVNNEFEVDKIVPSSRQQVQDEIPRFRAGQCNPSAAAGASSADPVEILFSNQPGSSETSLGRPALAAILVHLGKFRVLILPDVTEANLSRVEMRSRGCGVLRPTRRPAVSSRPDDRQIVALDSGVERHQTGGDRKRHRTVLRDRNAFM